MERLWRPWRGAYVRNAESLCDEGCIFCAKPESGDDRAALILHRGATAFVIMNLYPYNTGHVMVAPFRHAGDLEDLEEAERAELMELTLLMVRAVRSAMRPPGFNLGMNMGKAAGAGYDQHLHMHVVPRWQGDTNFMPVLAGSKVMPESITATYDRLLQALAALP